jgi:alkaline phosphatase D
LRFRALFGSPKGGGTMKGTTRRGFLKSTAFSGIGFALLSVAGLAKSRYALANPPMQIEPEPKINTGPVFERKSRLAGGKRSLATAWHPVLQGATSQTQTQFRILVDANRAYRYRVISSDGTKRDLSPRGRFGVPTSQMVIDHVYVDGLAAGETYQLEIEAGSRAERRWFSTLSKKSELGAPLRVALISCQNDRYEAEQSDMWSAVAESEPELMIFNGDCCYVDQRSDGTIEGMWDRHLTTRTMLDVFKWDRLVPVLTTWDDHDTGENDSDSSNPRLGIAAKYFDAMFGSDPVDGYVKSQSRAASFESHGIKFLLLDCRSNLSSTQVYSIAEEAWIAAQVQNASGPVWLVNGTQFFGGYLIGAESVEATSAQQLQRIMTACAKAEVPVGLMSGDVHFSELMELEPGILGYKSYEFTSSALHSRTFPGQQFRSFNERRFESTSKNNFLAIEMVANTKKQIGFELASLGSGQREFFRFRGQINR